MTASGEGSSLPSIQFDGPLELLLDEVRRQKVAIENVAMAPLVARFLAYVQTAVERKLNLDIEWLYMAATLIHWKSRALLPQTEDTQAAADPVRDELVQLLLAHKRQAAGDLEQRRANEERRFSRTAGGGGDEELRDGADLDRVVTVWDLIRQAREIANSASKYRDERLQAREVFEVDPDDVTVAEMIGDLQARLMAQQGVIDGTELLESQMNTSRRSCLFLGMLEMARDRLIEIEQREAFGPVWLRTPSAEL